MFKRIFYKKQARLSLKDRKKQAAAISVIPIVTIGVLYAVYIAVLLCIMKNSLHFSVSPLLRVIEVSAVCLVLLLAMTLVSFAYLRTVNDMQDQKPVGIKTIFSKFSPKAITAMLWATLWQLIWMIPLIIGAIVFFTASFRVTKAETVGSMLFMFSGGVLYLAGFIILYAKMLSYSMIYFILADNPELSVRRALRLSIAVTKGSRENILVMALSFYGWLLLGFLTLGIGFLWIGPYMTMAMRNAYAALKNNAISENILKASDFTVHKKITPHAAGGSAVTGNSSAAAGGSEPAETTAAEPANADVQV